MSEEEIKLLKRIADRLYDIDVSLGWIVFTLFLMMVGGCMGCYEVKHL